MITVSYTVKIAFVFHFTIYCISIALTVITIYDSPSSLKIDMSSNTSNQFVLDDVSTMSRAEYYDAMDPVVAGKIVRRRHRAYNHAFDFVKSARGFKRGILEPYKLLRCHGRKTTTNYVLCQHCSGDRGGKESADRIDGPNKLVA